jgi:hypothetical protein
MLEAADVGRHFAQLRLGLRRDQRPVESRTGLLAGVVQVGGGCRAFEFGEFGDFPLPGHRDNHGNR